MDNKDIINIALQQSAYDCNCSKEDFNRKENVAVISAKDINFINKMIY